MKKGISDCFCGVLDLLETGNSFDSHFSIDENLVTIMPLTKEAEKKVHELSYNDGSNEKDNWIYGYAEDNCAIAILQKSHLRENFSSSINLSAAKVFSPLIIKASSPYITDVKTFDTIEFYGGIVDKLHIPDLAIKNDVENGLIQYTDPITYTSQYEIVLDEIRFRVVYTVNVPTKIEIGQVPDLRNDIHAALRFEFESPQHLDTIQKYYSYAMNLFQFCAGRLNVKAEIRLYKKQFGDSILVKMIDGFSNYANDVIDFTKVIRFSFLEQKFTNLFKLLNNEKEKPYLLFLPSKNEDANKVLYTDVNDLCVAFEGEYSKQSNKVSEDKKQAARRLTEDLLAKIDVFGNCPDDVKEKARTILNAQLKAFSPSLREKIIYFYRKYKNELKAITEIEGHDNLGITKFYSDDEFEIMIKKFIDIRNKASHAGIQWNGGEQIFVHLKILIYCSVLERAGFSAGQIGCMLSWLFGWQF